LSAGLGSVAFAVALPLVVAGAALVGTEVTASADLSGCVLQAESPANRIPASAPTPSGPIRIRIARTPTIRLTSRCS